MELDFKYRQQFVNLNNSEEQSAARKLHQEVIDYLESHISDFDYNNLISLLCAIKTDTDLYLSDGTRVKVNASKSVIRMGVLFKNGQKFVGCWSNIVDNDEFMDAIDV